MTNPSSEAMAAAEDVLRTMQESRGLEYADPIDEIELGLLTTALDDHTAALRAEVKALRSRVAWRTVAEKFPPVVLSLYEPKAEDWVLVCTPGIKDVQSAYIRRYENGKTKWVMSGNRVGGKVEPYHCWMVPPDPPELSE